MTDSATPRCVEYTLTVSDTLHDRLNRMAGACGGGAREVLAKAIALYEVAVEAREQECSLAVLDVNNRIQTKIEGL